MEPGAASMDLYQGDIETSIEAVVMIGFSSTNDKCPAPLTDSVKWGR